MKACVLENIGRLVFKDVSDPIPRENEVLLRIRACGICSSDIPRIFVTGTYQLPTIPGHEFSGEIVSVGSKVDSALIGKRAAVFPLLPCKECSSCMKEEYARCENYNYFGSRCDGAFAEYIAVPVWNLAICPDDMSFELAALCEPAAVARHCADVGEIQAGKIVTVIGTGTIGILAALWAKDLGASKVVLAGRNNEKLDFAKSLGIDDVLNVNEDMAFDDLVSMTDGQRSDVVLECVGSEQSINTAINFAKSGGRVVLTGNPQGDILLKKEIYWRILRGELTVIGTWNSNFSRTKNDWKTAIECMNTGKLPASKLITHRFPLSEYKKAISIMCSKEIFSIKVMFTM